MRRLFFSVVLVTTCGTAHSATVGDDVINFSGTYQTHPGETIATPSGGTVTFSTDTRNVNDTTYDGLAGNDILFTTNLPDVLDERGGQVVENVETFVLGSGADILILDEPASSTNGGVLVSGGAGDDIVIMLGDSNDTIIAAGGNDFIDAGAGDDLVNGDADDDIVYAGAGKDDVRDGPGNDIYFLGSGDDILRMNHRTDGEVDTVHVGSGYDGINWQSLAIGPPQFLGATVESYDGGILTTLLEILADGTGGGSHFLRIVEDTNDPTGMLDYFSGICTTGNCDPNAPLGDVLVDRSFLLPGVPGIGTVPLPAGLPLLVAALGLLGGLGLRRRVSS